jgi:hypothetical protein
MVLFCFNYLKEEGEIQRDAQIRKNIKVYNFILCLTCLFYLMDVKNDTNGKWGHCWKGQDIMKFDFKELMNHQPKTKIIVTEKNQPNVDKWAKMIHELLNR